MSRQQAETGGKKTKGLAQFALLGLEQVERVLSGSGEDGTPRTKSKLIPSLNFVNLDHDHIQQKVGLLAQLFPSIRNHTQTYKP